MWFEPADGTRKGANAGKLKGRRRNSGGARKRKGDKSRNYTTLNVLLGPEERDKVQRKTAAECETSGSQRSTDRKRRYSKREEPQSSLHTKGKTANRQLFTPAVTSRTDKKGYVQENITGQKTRTKENPEAEGLAGKRERRAKGKKARDAEGYEPEKQR